ncbi:uncharacterized protein [Lolium perenne]|uniref:uncharacterized protein n=1 Tax=Lolium perenne TaxID=4522 RepID=UPI003A994938
MDGSKYRPKGYGMASSAAKRLPYLLLLLVFLTAAGLSVVVMHKVREQRVFAVLIQERDGKVISLRALLQKEKAYSKETKRKVEEMKATISSLRTQKTDLKTKLKGLEATATNLKTTQKELESSLKEKDSRISQMEETASDLHNIRIKLLEEKATAESNHDQMAALMEILQRKEAELEEIKTRFQGRKDPSSKRTPEQTNKAHTTPTIVVAGNLTNSSDTTIPATLEEKRAGNTTVTESKHQKQKARSLEEKKVKLAGDIEVDDLQDTTSDDFLDIDDIYGDSHSKKSEFPRRNNNDLMNSHVDNQKSRHSPNQDSDHLRSNKLLKKENSKADETKKDSTAGHLEEKSSKNSLSNADLDRPKQGAKEMAGAANVKPNVPANDDATQQQNKRQKNKKSKTKKIKMIDTPTINGNGEVTKER